MLRTANPALNEKSFARLIPNESADVMTLQGTVNKTSFLILLTMAAAMWSWGQFAETGTASIWTLGAAIGGFVVALITMFKKEWSSVTAPLYALFEGVFLGALSAMVNASYPGIAIQAVTLTFGTLAGLLLAYKSGAIKVTENFKLGIVAATGGIAIFYLIAMVIGFFGIHMPLINSNGPMGIVFSLVVVVIAALNLVLDFDFIENACRNNAPKYMEWFAGFGLLVTLVWLYVEILRLLIKLQSRRD